MVGQTRRRRYGSIFARRCRLGSGFERGDKDFENDARKRIEVPAARRLSWCRCSVCSSHQYWREQVSVFTSLASYLTKLSSWTRIITKTTNRITEVVRLLSNTNIPRLASQYKELRQLIVGERMNELWNSFYSVQPPITEQAIQQQWAISQSSFGQLVNWDDQTNQFVMGDDTFEQGAFYLD